MLFNSINFLFFIIVFFCLYWFVFKNNLKKQNLLILVASYIFYGWWDWRFLSLIAISTVIDYLMGYLINESVLKSRKRIFLSISLLSNLGMLGFFKYFNFFIYGFSDLLDIFGLNVNISTLNIILPVGISFYTFQTLSYTIDIYRGRINATKNLIAFASFVSFFPQLVAGPIERASKLLPQFEIKRKFDFDKARDGVRQILWGFFKKIVIADNLSQNVDYIYSNYSDLDPSILLLGAIFFSFQIYCDFSGYSDIAIGLAKIFGFELMTNFKYPYFSKNIKEFWHRWHISLSTWFRDYVYFPLGGSINGSFNHIRNIILIFTISGFWHGANWTFITWGFLHGIAYIPLLILNKSGKIWKNLDYIRNKYLNWLRNFVSILLTFSFVTITWIFFRANSITIAIDYLKLMFQKGLFTFPSQQRANIPILVIFIMVEWIQKDKVHPLQIGNLNVVLRYCIYLVVSFVILLFGSDSDMSFIYFQF